MKIHFLHVKVLFSLMRIHFSQVKVLFSLMRIHFLQVKVLLSIMRIHFLRVKSLFLNTFDDLWQKKYPSSRRDIPFVKVI